ncbi:MAG: carboxymuconolactone decarboxylase family protein [Planctomycetes bacterium]|nr:carboxymuconolactone decarboxylase family protein [Planctomycetota bacterium]
MRNDKTPKRAAASPARRAAGPNKTHFQRFGAEFPEVAAAYTALGEAALRAGPLDTKTRSLVKLALAVGAWREGAVHSTAGRALAAGCTPAEIRHAVVLATTTLGFPSMMAAMRWVDEVVKGGRRKRRVSGRTRK